MEVIDLSLRGLKLIKPLIFKDSRGFFTEVYKADYYKQKGIGSTFVQDNHSFSCEKVIRGMHFQKFPGQDKLITVVGGTIFDVAVDIRPSSPTFGKWESVILGEDHPYQLFIPNGFAHGFCVLSKSAHLVYKVSNYFDPENEMTFSYKDPEVNIKWPVKSPIVSEKDKNAPSFDKVCR
jgi:dTDP-4-dehydrorhamnose 3,5-epimerase